MRTYILIACLFAALAVLVRGNEAAGQSTHVRALETQPDLAAEAEATDNSCDLQITAGHQTAPNMAHNPAGGCHTLFFHNKTKSRIKVAVHFVRHDQPGSWTTKGWYVFEPNERASVLHTKNSYYYFYAEAMDGSGHWGGVASGDGWWHAIEDGGKRYSFAQAEIPQPGWKAHTQSLSD